MGIDPGLLKMHHITIICDQTDCTHNKGGYTAHDYTWENRCNNPRTVIINNHCESKNTSILNISITDNKG
jgi:hypothetical protein